MPAALLAQSRGLRVEWIEGAVPAAVASECVMFPRAYTCSPDKGVGRGAFETSRFPHAQREIDAPLARLLAAETITVYTSESGDGNDRWTDRSTRVPLAIRWPGKLAPRVASELLISHADVLPTLLGLAKIAVPTNVQGRDLSARLSTGRGEFPEAVYAEGRIGMFDEWRMLVRGFDKLVWNMREETVALYNLASDPEEQKNLLEERGYALMRDSMWALAKEWMRRLEDGMDPSGLRLRR